GAIGEPSAVQPLITTLSDPLSSVRAASAESLGRLRAAASVDALTQKLSDPQAEVRVKAAQAIWRINRDAEVAVTALVRALRHRHAGSDAQFILAEIRPAAQDPLRA